MNSWCYYCLKFYLQIKRKFLCRFTYGKSSSFIVINYTNFVYYNSRTHARNSTKMHMQLDFDVTSYSLDFWCISPNIYNDMPYISEWTISLWDASRGGNCTKHNYLCFLSWKSVMIQFCVWSHDKTLCAMLHFYDEHYSYTPIWINIVKWYRRRICDGYDICFLLILIILFICFVFRLIWLKWDKHYLNLTKTPARKCLKF